MRQARWSRVCVLKGPVQAIKQGFAVP